jgi:hypothetical protein
MLHASAAHVANDWLAVPLSTWTLVALLDYWREPAPARAARLGAAAVASKAWRKWYARNAMPYGNLGGMQQTAAGGVGAGEVLQASLSLPWHTALPSLGCGGLWTGNSSFTSFSAVTLNVVLALLVAGLVLWARKVWTSRRRTTVFFAHTGGSRVSATPWYTQAVWAPLVCLVSLGLARSGLWGVWAGASLSVLTAYLQPATYLVRLIPMYSGCAGRMTVSGIWSCYADDPAGRQRVLAETSLGPSTLVLALAVTAAAVASAAVLCRRMVRDWRNA